jgi:NAD(P)-dependent dehydrogenase (short-subunit alcohol dehydrogenase family)
MGGKEMRLKNKVALITGAGSGIGRATAMLFAREGASLVVVDIASEGGMETVQLIRGIGQEATFIQADVSKATDMEKAVKICVEKYGKLDIVFNNAGVSQECSVVEMSEGEWDHVINVNLKGVFFGSKYAIPEMIKGGGVIINTASTLGLIAEPNCAAYCASKGGVIALTRALAVECAPYNIRVNCICPGPIATPMILKEPQQQVDVSYVPLKRLGKPEEIAYAALFLASDESTYVTGSTLMIDGGTMAV